MMDLSIPYYEDNTRTSNSSIGWFLKEGPIGYKRRLDGIVQNETGRALEKGTMIHEYILQPEEFNNDYVVFTGSKPTSTNQQKFCEYLINSTEIEPEKALLSAYKRSYSIVGKTEATMLSEATKMASTLKDYIDVLRDGRAIISQYDVQKCEACLQNIKDHKMASVLLNDSNYEEHHEFHINWEKNGVRCKSLLDCVKFDFKNKKCQLIDLKTTVKLWHFQDSVLQYDYLRQLCFYWMAIRWYLENERGEDPESWTVEFYIIGIDSTNFSDIRVFKFTLNEVLQREGTIIDTLFRIAWHTKENKWEHTVEYYLGDGCEVLHELFEDATTHE